MEFCKGVLLNAFKTHTMSCSLSVENLIFKMCPFSPLNIPRFLVETADSSVKVLESIMGTLVTILIDLHMSGDKIVCTVSNISYK